MTFDGARLTRTQKNAVFEDIAAAGLYPGDFQWIEDQRWDSGIGPETVSRLVHTQTGYWFQFGTFGIACSPGRSIRHESVFELSGFPPKAEYLRAWLQRLRTEIEAPDLWAMVGKERELASAVMSEIDNSPFIDAEKIRIRLALDEIKEYVLTVAQLQVEQRHIVDRQFLYLAGALDRQGRRDWTGIFLGNVIGLVLALAVTPENVHGLLRLAGTLLHGLWSEAQGLLP